MGHWLRYTVIPWTKAGLSRRKLIFARPSFLFSSIFVAGFNLRQAFIHEDTVSELKIISQAYTRIQLNDEWTLNHSDHLDIFNYCSSDHDVRSTATRDWHVCVQMVRNESKKHFVISLSGLVFLEEISFSAMKMQLFFEKQNEPTILNDKNVHTFAHTRRAILSLE